MFAKDSPWGQPQAESQTQLFVTHLPVTMATGVGGGSQQIAGQERGREGDSAHHGGRTDYF